MWILNTLMERFHNSAHLSQRSDGLCPREGHRSMRVRIYILSNQSKPPLCVRDCTQAHRKHWPTATPLFNLPHGFPNKLARLLSKLKPRVSETFTRNCFQKTCKSFGDKNISRLNFTALKCFGGGDVGGLIPFCASLCAKRCCPNAAANIRILFEPMSLHFPDPPPAPPPSSPLFPAF